MSFKQTFVFGAFEERDKDDILDRINIIESLRGKISKKGTQKRAINKESRDLQQAEGELLEKALEPTQRFMPTSQDSGKPKLGVQSRKAIRNLFILVTQSGTKDTDETQLRGKVEELVRALKIDGVDFKTLDIEETPALAFEQRGAPLTVVKEEDVLALVDEIDWGSPNPSEYGKEEDIKVEDEDEEDEATVPAPLDWPGKLAEERFSFAAWLEKRLNGEDGAPEEVLEDEEEEEDVREDAEEEIVQDVVQHNAATRNWAAAEADWFDDD